MLISLPLLAPDSNFAPDFVVQGIDLLQGVYPVGPGQIWHGGCHLCCPASKILEVRAIADGTIVGYRIPTPRPPDPTDHKLNYGGGWTDDGFILLKHEKESGENVPVIFYSLYMHLSSIGKEKLLEFQGTPGEVMKDGRSIARKDVLGELGCIHGRGHSMHFEIFTDTDSLEKFFTPTDLTKASGTRPPWGDTYFFIPKGTPYTLNTPQPKGEIDTPFKTATDLFITLRYETGDRIFTAHLPTGEEIGRSREKGAEYQLYREAQRWFPKNTSVGYELLRYGRRIGPDPLPEQASNWQQIPFGFGPRGWIDLNQPKIHLGSDADFPHWQWRQVAENSELFNAADSKCDVPELISIFDAQQTGINAPLETKLALTHKAFQERNRSLVCQFPSEWDFPTPGTVKDRLGWVMDYFKNPASREKELAEKQKAWIKAVCASLEKRRNTLEALLTETKIGKQRHEEQLAILKPQLAEAQKAAKAAAQDAAKKQAELKSAKKQRKTASTAIDKAQAAADEAAAQATETSEATATFTLAVKNESEAIAEATRSIEALGEAISAAQKTKERETRVLADADKAITAATEAMKLPSKNPDEAWKRFVDHVIALQWWEKLKSLCELPESTVWHFHPTSFIEHFRKCHWLSSKELRLIYSNNISKKSDPEHSRILETYRIAINKVFLKYGITTPVRMSHYLGQGALESDFLHSMQEKAMTPNKIEDGNAYGSHINEKSTIPEIELGHWYGSEPGENNDWFCYNMYNSKGKLIASSYSWRNGNCGDIDAIKFRGRGFKQLTGLSNYSNYWIYRNWIDQQQFDKNWETDPHYKEKNRSAMKKRPPEIPDPHRITTDAYNCIDISGWYITFLRNNTTKSIDNDSLNSIGTAAETSIVTTVTRAINGAEKNLDERIKYTQHTKKIIL